MKKLRELLPGGLEWKLIRFAVIFVVILGIVFFAMSRIQIAQLSNEVKIHEGERSEFIKGEYTQSMNNVTSDSLLQLSIWAADKTDDEFWIIDHDLRVLARQVEEIYRHPENYERLPVQKPEKKNDGDNKSDGDEAKVEPNTEATTVATDTAPKTSDDSAPELMMVLLAMSLFGMGTMYFLGRKKNNK